MAASIVTKGAAKAKPRTDDLAARYVTISAFRAPRLPVNPERCGLTRNCPTLGVKMRLVRTC